MFNPYNFNYNPNYNAGYAQQGNQTIQNAGFVSVQSEEEARMYPMQHGMSVTFRDENSPYIYVKTIGFGQLDTPIFEKYRLTKEDAQSTRRAEIAPQREETDKLSNYVTKAEYGQICNEIDELRETVEKLRKELGA